MDLTGVTWGLLVQHFRIQHVRPEANLALACRLDLLLLIDPKFNWPSCFLPEAKPNLCLRWPNPECHTFRKLGPWPRASLLPQRHTAGWEIAIRQHQSFQTSAISNSLHQYFQIQGGLSDKLKDKPIHAHKIVQVDQLTVSQRPFANLQRTKPGKAAYNLAVLTAVPHFQLWTELGSAPRQDSDSKIW